MKIQTNKLIVLEGLDGGGKSTQLKLVKEYFEKINQPYSYYHFPRYGQSEFAGVIAAYLRGEFGEISKVDPYFVATQFIMDMWKNSENIKNQLKSGIVLLDRYVGSTIAYQSANLNDIEKIKLENFINDLAFNMLGLRIPNLVLFFDTPINIIKERLDADRSKTDDREYLNGKQDIHELDIEFQSRVRDNYIQAKPKLINQIGFNIIKCCDEDNKLMTPKEIFLTYKLLL